jgi:hypothetical protein
MVSRRIQSMIFLLALCTLPVTIGCASLNSQRGTENLWRGADAAQWKIGETTDQDILNTLGPPSQLIALNDEVVYYYMLEKTKKRTMIFFIYNTTKQNVTYDRAMFIFDKAGGLQKFSLSQIVEEKPKE